MHTYDSAFYKYINSGAIRSANAVLPLLMNHVKTNRVADFGCGQGAWLAVWKKLGSSKVIGIDGAYVDRNCLLIDPGEFSSYDLEKPIDLGEKFDLVQSLEVAEHLPECAAHGFVNSLVSHSQYVLFSAAVPGQGGENHINEQPYEYWRRLFKEKGYVPIDAIRPHIKNNKRVMPWYRYNTLLYVNESILDELPNELRKYAISGEHKIPNVSPIPYRLRRLLLHKLLPLGAYTWLATVKKQFFVFTRRWSKVSTERNSSP